MSVSRLGSLARLPTARLGPLWGAGGGRGINPIGRTEMSALLVLALRVAPISKIAGQVGNRWGGACKINGAVIHVECPTQFTYIALGTKTGSHDWMHGDTVTRVKAGCALQRSSLDNDRGTVLV